MKLGAMASSTAPTAPTSKGASDSSSDTSSHAREMASLRLSVVVYVVVFALKIAAYLHTGVMALLAEGLHTLSDIFVSAFLLLAAHWSRKKADEVHMFGYGRAQYVGAIVAATLFISFTSIELCREAVPRLLEHHEAQHANLSVAIGVLALSMLVAAAPLVSLLRQKRRGAAAKAMLMELVNDELGLLAALLGTLFVLWGYPIADPISALVVAAIIGINGASLFRENLSYLVGRTPGAETMQQLEQSIRAVDGVRDLHRLRAQLIGPDSIHAEVHINVARGISIEEADEIGKRVTRRVADEIGCSQLAIHIDPERVSS